MAIFAPALARPSAMARPIPLFPPVTIATLPFSDIALLLFHGTERTRYPRPLVQSDGASMSYRRAPATRLHEAPARLASDVLHRLSCNTRTVPFVWIKPVVHPKPLRDAAWAPSGVHRG